MVQVTGRRPGMTDAEVTAIIHGIAEGFTRQVRSPILKTPKDAGLAFEDVTFPSEDGVPLEAWFIPRDGSDKLIIVNHPRGFNRYGCPSHLEPWRAIGAMGGNDFEVDFIPDLKLFNEAGYNVLTYDLRNHGHSGCGQGGMITSGRFESRDVIGSLAYARARSDLQRMTIGLFSRCMGCNATLFAMARRPELFREVRCLVGVQPVSVRAIMSGILDLLGVGAEHVERLGDQIRLVTSFGLDDLSPREAARSVEIPTLLYQVRDDVMTSPEDVAEMFRNLGTSQKAIFWIDGTTRRWDGYTYFARRPARILEWFETYMTANGSVVGG